MAGVLLTAACSTTKLVPDDDKLFIGLTKIDYQNYEKNDQSKIGRASCRERV